MKTRRPDLKHVIALFMFSTLIGCSQAQVGDSTAHFPGIVKRTDTHKTKTQTPGFRVLYNFAGEPDGSFPVRLILDCNGAIYGTTYFGGASNYGTIFTLAADGTLTNLHSFAGGPTDGQGPTESLIMDHKGNLFGTTQLAGAFGLGTVFELATDGTLTILHSFSGTTDGNGPICLLMDNRQNLYGTTIAGGVSGRGTVFKMDSSGAFSLLHTFTGSDGDGPSSLLMDKKGNLFGTTQARNNAFNGTVFKIDTDGVFTVLYNFGTSPTDGDIPSELVMDHKGSLFGTTPHGGSSGIGSVFELTANGEMKLLHSFSGPDGMYPSSGLVLDHKGNLYGTTSEATGDFGYGTVFKLDSTGTLTTVYGFSNSTNGASPRGNMIMGHKGNLYGHTSYGGTYRWGNIFELTNLK